MENEVVKRLRYKSERFTELSDWVRALEYATSNEMKLRMIDSSSRVLLHVETTEKKTICVDIGLGVYVEMTLPEAVAMAEKQSKLLSEEADRIEQEWTQQAACGFAIARGRDWALTKERTTS